MVDVVPFWLYFVGREVVDVVVLHHFWFVLSVGVGVGEGREVPLWARRAIKLNSKVRS